MLKFLAFIALLGECFGHIAEIGPKMLDSYDRYKARVGDIEEKQKSEEEEEEAEEVEAEDVTHHFKKAS